MTTRWFEPTGESWPLPFTDVRPEKGVGFGSSGEEKLMTHNYSRRRFASMMGLAGAGTLAAGRAVAELVTPAQVEGPFYPVTEQLDKDVDLTRIKGQTAVATGEVILVTGRVTGADGRPLANALVDVWQANHHGRYAHPADKNPAPLDPAFQGWGMMRTDAEGAYQFRTIKPGAYPLSFIGESGWRCQHIHFKVRHPDARNLTTQMYFEGDPLIETDGQASGLSDRELAMLVCSSTPDADSGLPQFRFDVVLG
jgi:protocatechuate 3,4-dioxygenase beta subunit